MQQKVSIQSLPVALFAVLNTDHPWLSQVESETQNRLLIEFRLAACTIVCMDINVHWTSPTHAPGMAGAPPTTLVLSFGL